MGEHVLIRKVEHLTGSAAGPRLAYGVETRTAPGPVFKKGAWPDDVVWIKLHGGLVIAKARVQLSWIAEYSTLGEVRSRTRGTPLHDIADFWAGRPKVGYAAVVELAGERWIDPHWAGPRTYGYEWVVLDDDKKRATWLESKAAPRGGDELLESFLAWREGRAGA